MMKMTTTAMMVMMITTIIILSHDSYERVVIEMIIITINNGNIKNDDNILEYEYDVFFNNDTNTDNDYKEHDEYMITMITAIIVKILVVQTTVKITSNT